MTSEAPALRSACVAPHAALYFQPDGEVRACCATAWAAGSITGPERRTLAEIWASAELEAQRRALEHDDFSFGCQECEFAIVSGSRDSAVVSGFDRFAPGAPHASPKLLDFALSSRCNLQCVMCHGGLSSSIRTRREGLPPLPSAYDDAFFEELSDWLPDAEKVHFKGGEPFLGPENRRIWDELIARRLHPEVMITTNGTVWSDDVERYLTELRMSPIISVDGMTPEVLEATRVGVVAPVFWDHVDRIQAAAASVGRPLSFSMCVMSTNWREVPLVLAEADRRGAYVGLVLVNQPFRFDLFRLPTEELEQVRRTWADTPLELTAGHLADEWERIQGLVRSQVEQPVELQVSVPHRTEAPVDERVQAELASKMAAAAGEEPLSFEVDDGRVRLRNRPEWAQWLVAGGFDGSAFADLEDLIAANTGGQVAVGRLAREHKGVSRWMLAVQLPESSRRLEINFFADEATGQARALVVPEATGGRPA